MLALHSGSDLHGIHHTLKIQRVLGGQDWMSRLTEDRRGLTPLPFGHVDTLYQRPLCGW